MKILFYSIKNKAVALRKILQDIVIWKFMETISWMYSLDATALSINIFISSIRLSTIVRYLLIHSNPNMQQIIRHTKPIIFIQILIVLLYNIDPTWTRSFLIMILSRNSSADWNRSFAFNASAFLIIKSSLSEIRLFICFGEPISSLWIRSIAPVTFIFVTASYITAPNA